MMKKISVAPHAKASEAAAAGRMEARKTVSNSK